MNQFTQLDREAFLAQKLSDLTVPVFNGATTTESRREAFRCAIIDANLGDKRFGKNKAGVVETFSDYFFETYKTPLYRDAV
jgi:hypothetical protein